MAYTNGSLICTNQSILLSLTSIATVATLKYLCLQLNAALANPIITGTYPLSFY